MSPSAASQREEIGKNSGAASQMRAQRAIDMRSLRTKRQKQEYDTASQVENFWGYASAASQMEFLVACERSEQDENGKNASAASKKEML